MIQPGLGTDANKAQLYFAQSPATEPVEYLDEDQLIGEAVVNPDNDFLVL